MDIQATGQDAVFRTPILAEEFPAHIFLSGTGTGVGKTVAAAVLCRLREAEYWKPIQSGQLEDDTLELLRLAPGTAVHLPAVSLREPASPHLSAQREGVRISVEELCEGVPEAYYLLVEGAGGILVPVNESQCMADLALSLAMPVVVVASSTLGTINHTLMTLEALKSRSIAVAGVVLVGDAHGANACAIRDRGGVPVLLRIPEMFPLDSAIIDRFCHNVLDGLVADPCQEETPVAVSERPGDLVARDGAVIWHPYAQHATMPAPLAVERGHGALLWSQDGNEYIDAVSSWWVTGHGHGHPKVARAIAEQARKLEQVIFSGCTHEPAVRLAERLLENVPGRLSRVFYSDNGSTAVEVAIKALVQRAQRMGCARPRVAAFEGAYHGDTFGAMAASARSPFTQDFDPWLFEVDRLPTPAGPWQAGSEAGMERERTALAAFAAWAEVHRGEVACVVVEPLVQGSGGMMMYSRGFLVEFDRICQEYDVPWVADEVFTGFGRTGRMFACDGEDLRPWAVCLSKGLTAGFLPMGATCFREEVFEVFLSQDRSRTFFHGHSYTANPLGCAAALAGLDLCEEPGYLERVAVLESRHREQLESLGQRFELSGVRVLGGIAAFELPDAPSGYLANRGQQLSLACRERGAVVRPLGDTIYLMPPYCIRKGEMERLYRIVAGALNTL
jgi:adenosylmethionine---8-amino-7-oxononanoate aminotransferase